MNGKVRYGKTAIPYSILKSNRRKTSEIQVDEKGVILRVPESKTKSEIQNIMEGKKQWIFKKKLEFETRRKLKTLKVKEKTAKYLEKRTYSLATKFGFSPSNVIVKKMRSRWGSAGKTGIITINEELTKTSSRIIDYVIIHELCHLKIKDHSYRYWNLVRKLCPQYEKRIKELEEFRII